MRWDRFDSQTKLRFRIVDQKFVNFFSGEAISLLEGTTGEIVLGDDALSDDMARFLRKEEKRLLVQAGTEVLLGFTKATENLGELVAVGDENLSQSQNHDLAPSGFKTRFVRIKLLSDLYLLMRGTKRSRLLDCAVKVPWQEEEHQSLNQAYTAGSVRYEPTRKSHSGNVFRYGYVASDDRFISLDLLRDEREGLFQVCTYMKIRTEDQVCEWLRLQLQDEPQPLEDLEEKIGRAWPTSDHKVRRATLLDSIRELRCIENDGIFYLTSGALS